MFKGSRTEDIDISSFQSQESLQCNTHTSLVSRFEEYCRSTSHAIAQPQKDMGFRGGLYPGEVTIRSSISKGCAFWDLLLVKERMGTDDSAKGDIMNPDWVDLTKVKQWKTECLNSHGSECENPLKIWTTRPAWLVDVELEYLVPGPLEVEFVALSYTNGRHLGLNQDSDLNAELLEPYAFRKPAVTTRLPPILRHAMFLTKALGERYLWVDTLCITPGSSEETASQLIMMGSIYASAVVTIIAADRDAEEGILGYSSLAQGKKPYFSRAWTFQEHKMAKRKLFFLKKQAHWECQHQQFHEEFAAGAEVHASIESSLVESLAGFPVLSSVSNLICKYNLCELRYDEDALLGITGLLSVLSRSFDGGFLYGIPEMFFDRALAWGPYLANTELERRTQSSRPRPVQLQPSHLPSWSWVGWKGIVSLGDEASRANDRHHKIEETYPITKWYTAMSPTTDPSKRRRIHSKWYKDREEWKNMKMELPGWTRIELESDKGTVQGEPRMFPTGCGGSVYRHQNMPKAKDWGSTNDWYFPFPVPNISNTTMPSMPEQTPYLFSRVQQARVLGRRNNDRGITMTLYDKLKGHIIGTLRLHSMDQLQPFPSLQKPSGDNALEIEVVAISVSRIQSKTFNKEKSCYGEPFLSTEQYNVLWIEWKEGIAYRKAGGLVQKEQWEQLEREDIDLILG
ncbi:HET-domain-containing protein [Dothidotthia symphoricarpi CBS 119687]|uniref:HET-domain-containing protein n=1 Tax=Dothidotthia symphoricarpi CBS 119687 TaxID=1392245 RepID=A0A6A6A749_9PLEO|nr:HET-domain-containing protein [Dothidotthia symphoricarpi CBS 119687]KAF2127045.1 HET-domain-containing protein [Dothidotthia symphoricarpi CBS 119687]